MDDSGTRHPDRKMGRVPEHGNDWFALGGVLYLEADEPILKQLHKDFCDKWQIQWPLHSSEIRARSDKFSFIGRLGEQERAEFYEDLYCLMRDCPTIGHACVVDRPGYNNRYREKYGRQRWLLCKSAFSILVERAAKFVATQDGKLRVFVEKSDKRTDRIVRGYYDELRDTGAPFAATTSAKYEPSDSETLNDVLYEFRLKEKSSPAIQLADLYLWPIAMGGYKQDCRPYRRLQEDSKLIDNVVNNSQQAIKYYCFDNKRPNR